MRLVKALGVSAVAFGICLALPGYLGGYQLSLVFEVLQWIALCGSWFLFSGYTGYPSLAHSAFFGAGSYVAATLWPKVPLVGLIILGALAAFAAALTIGVPVLRVSKTFFVVLTLGINIFVLHLVAYYQITVRGSIGTLIMGAPDSKSLFLAAAALAILSTLTIYLVSHSKFGRGLIAIRENEQTAQSVGVEVGLYKWLAFGLSAAFAGAMGAVIVLRWTYLDPYVAFNPDISFKVIIMTLFGGGYSVVGPIVGAVILTIMQEFLSVYFPRGYLILLGLLLIGLVTALPKGMVGAFSALGQGFRRRNKVGA